MEKGVPCSPEDIEFVVPPEVFDFINSVLMRNREHMEANIDRNLIRAVSPDWFSNNDDNAAFKLISVAYEKQGWAVSLQNFKDMLSIWVFKPRKYY